MGGLSRDHLSAYRPTCRGRYESTYRAPGAFDRLAMRADRRHPAGDVRLAIGCPRQSGVRPSLHVRPYLALQTYLYAGTTRRPGAPAAASDLLHTVITAASRVVRPTVLSLG
jgi:hypothetical protein